MLNIWKGGGIRPRLRFLGCNLFLQRVGYIEHSVFEEVKNALDKCLVADNESTLFAIARNEQFKAEIVVTIVEIINSEIFLCDLRSEAVQASHLLVKLLVSLRKYLLALVVLDTLLDCLRLFAELSL